MDIDEFILDLCCCRKLLLFFWRSAEVARPYSSLSAYLSLFVIWVCTNWWPMWSVSLPRLSDLFICPINLRKCQAEKMLNKLRKSKPPTVYNFRKVHWNDTCPNTQQGVFLQMPKNNMLNSSKNGLNHWISSDFGLSCLCKWFEVLFGTMDKPVPFTWPRVFFLFFKFITDFLIRYLKGFIKNCWIIRRLSINFLVLNLYKSFTIKDKFSFNYHWVSILFQLL